MAKGDLSRSPYPGKKIDTVYYDIDQDVDGVATTGKVAIDIHMQKKFGNSDVTPYETTSIWFTVICKTIKFSEGGTDLDALLKFVRSKLTKHYSIKWERWLYVMVEPSRIYDGTGSGMVLSWKDVERGVTMDGDVLLRQYNMHADWSNRWEIKPWPKQFKDSSGKVRACIRATKENEDALEQFAEKIREMTKALADFVSPDNIETTLAAIAANQLKLLS